MDLDAYIPDLKAPRTAEDLTIPAYLLDTPCSWCGERIVFPDKHECEPDDYWRIEEAGRKRFQFNQRMGWYPRYLVIPRRSLLTRLREWMRRTEFKALWNPFGG